MAVQLHAFFTSVLDGVEWSDSQYSCFTSRESPLYDRRLGGPHSRSERFAEEKDLGFRRKSNPDSPVVQPAA
jgi:hypothetical protein